MWYPDDPAHDSIKALPGKPSRANYSLTTSSLITTPEFPPSIHTSKHPNHADRALRLFVLRITSRLRRHNALLVPIVPLQSARAFVDERYACHTDHANNALDVRAARVRVRVEAVSGTKAEGFDDVADGASEALGLLLGRHDGCGEGGGEEETELHDGLDWGRDC